MKLKRGSVFAMIIESLVFCEEIDILIAYYPYEINLDSLSKSCSFLSLEFRQNRNLKIFCI